MNICVAIPCHNHAETLPKVLSDVRKAMSDVFTIVVDDGSDVPVEASGAFVLRRPRNGGKAAALLDAFAEARRRGFTHVITMDADNQHPAGALPDFVALAARRPDAIIVGVRDFENSSIPSGRKFMNKFSNFWFAAETGIKLGDTQCGFRCYPLSALDKLDLRLGGFVFEVELLVKAAWFGIPIESVKIPAVYGVENLAKSHYRPIVDTAKFSAMNSKLFFTRVFTTAARRKLIAAKK